MDFPQQNTVNKTRVAQHLLEEARAALDVLSNQTDGAPLDPEAVAAQARVVSELSNAALQQIANCLDDEYARARQVADAVRESEERMTMIADLFPVGIAITGLDRKPRFINKVFEEVLGYDLAELSRHNSTDIYWDPQDELRILDTLRSDERVRDFELQLKRKDGQPIWVLLSAIQGIYNGEMSFIGSFQEITWLKSHEIEINQLNCTLKALTSSSQAMLHATDEQTYLNDVCRIIIEDCGFSMAWIGYAEDDEKKSVQPVASSGFDQGYIDQLKITWADTERGRGPTGTAIRTHHPCRCNNMLTDTKFAPWREAAIKRGYASSLVLPLISNGRAFGVLNIYSREANGFSNEEEKLLVELAGDLSYGISTLRLKVDQSLAEESLRLSEERYRTIVETSQEGIVMASPQGVYFYANRRMAEMLDCPVEEILGKSALLFADSGQEMDIEQAQKSLAEGIPFHGEFKFIRKDGSVLWSLYNASPIFSDKGEHVANLSMHTDITERKQMEEHLAYLASFPEMNPRPIIEVDLAGNLIYSNSAALKIFPGIKKRKLAHEYLTNWESIMESLQHESSGIVTRDIAVGSRYYEQSFNILPSRDLVRIYGMDITDRKLADQALLDAHEELEQRVLRRTQELDIANEQLRSEIGERQRAQVELESSVQELQVIEEELRNNNEMLVDAQKVLETERQRYQDLFDYAPDGYLVTDADGLIREANQFACKLLDIAHGRLIRKPLLVFIAKSDRYVFEHLLSTLLYSHDIQSNELKLLPRSGIELTAAVTVSGAKDRTGKPVLRWTLRDITESKRAEEIIRQNSLRNEILSELSQALAEATLDEQAVLDIVAQTTARFIGDSCVINVASPDNQWLNPVTWHHNDPEVQQVMDSIFSTSHHSSKEGLSGKVFQSSKAILIPRVEPLIVESASVEIHTYVDQIGLSSILIVPMQILGKTFGTISLIRNKDGNPFTADDQVLLEIIAYRTTQTVHTARLYRELQDAMHKELETHDQLVQAEKFAAVGRLLASITHEINNPLQTIKNCLYLCQMDIPAGTPVADSLAMAATETNRLSNLVAQLREIYRPPTSGLNRPVNIPTLLGEVQSLLASYIQDKHVKWELDPSTANQFDHLVIEGVSDQLKQVFLNIALNASDAMEASNGGILNINLKLSDDNRQAGVSFHDTGPGLSQEIKDRLFEPFVTTKEKGLGLGLVICYDIIQKHNGSIEVVSEPGEGATFTVWLPISKE